LKRAFLYIDILGFEHLVRTNPSKVDNIFTIFDTLKVFKHFALQTVVFSDTILIFNKDDSRPTHYYCTFLIEYAQELFYRLSLINVYFKGILTFGEFNFSELQRIQAYYGLALIDAYHDESLMEGFGLYVDKRLSNDIVVFDKVPFTEKYDFVLLTQSLRNLYNDTAGKLPIPLSMLEETDTYHRIDEDLRFFREIEFLKQNHPNERVKQKHSVVYETYKQAMPSFFERFEKEGFSPFTVNSEYTGRINPFDLLADKELNSEMEN